MKKQIVEIYNVKYEKEIFEIALLSNIIFNQLPETYLETIYSIKVDRTLTFYMN